MNNIKQAVSLLQPHLNSGERIQKSILGMYQQLTAVNSTPKKGILCATNERLCFFSNDMEQPVTSFDYYKLEAVDLTEDQTIILTLTCNGETSIMSFIEEGDAADFNHFVLDRMEIKS
ncbi:PH domain-containing protein [Kurthia sibirica]|uniref:YokE-like PH domain-containing protein n=1 Tax=Kurthia sibirica TaxID=202750 RepID=A0A2U3AIK9_9BACL|nr:PH domain-containing protein [Kurthia sibirica]PWI24383.1 hypothetical protein DEX24_13685 [Kurthia sibirica]GEK33800.1 hypothetical protein KSI01_13330 [Kurthia sibirica]